MPSILSAFNQIFHRKEKSEYLDVDPSIKSKTKKNKREKPIGTSIRCYPLRFGRGVEIISSMKELMNDVNLPSLFVLSALGKIRQCRMNGKELHSKEFHLISLNGTFHIHDEHLFATLFDCQTNTYHCGYVSSLIVSDSMELILAEPLDCHLNREIHPKSKENILFVQRKTLDQH